MNKEPDRMSINYDLQNTVQHNVYTKQPTDAVLLLFPHSHLWSVLAGFEGKTAVSALVSVLEIWSITGLKGKNSTESKTITDAMN